MQDFLNANSIQIEIDETGKVWVNVDGTCQLRIGHVNQTEYVHHDNHFGRSRANLGGDVVKFTDDFSVFKAKRGVIPQSQHEPESHS